MVTGKLSFLRLFLRKERGGSKLSSDVMKAPKQERADAVKGNTGHWSGRQPTLSNLQTRTPKPERQTALNQYSLLSSSMCRAQGKAKHSLCLHGILWHQLAQQSHSCMWPSWDETPGCWALSLGVSHHTVAGAPPARPCQVSSIPVLLIPKLEDFLSGAVGQDPSSGDQIECIICTKTDALQAWADVTERGERVHIQGTCLPEEWELIRILPMKAVFLESSLCFLWFIQNRSKLEKPAFCLFFKICISEWKSILQK